MKLRVIAVSIFWMAAAIAQDEAALLEAIRKYPAEDTPRLIYADWLEEHGRFAQAHFIRDSIASYRNPNSGAPPTSEQQATWNAGVDASLFGSSEVLEKAGVRVIWQRGFPSDLSLPVRALSNPRVVDALNRLPIVGRVRFQKDPDPTPVGTLAKRAQKLTLLERIPAASFLFMEGPMVYMEAIASRLKSVSALELSVSQADPLAGLARTEIAPRLKSLRLTGYSHNYAVTFRSLVQSGRFTSLKALKLDFDNLILDPLGNLGALPALRELDIRSSHPLREQLEQFVESAAFRQLRIFRAPGQTFRSHVPTFAQPHLLLPMILRVSHQLVDVVLEGTQNSEELAAQLEQNRRLLSPPVCGLLTLECSEIPPA